MFPRLLSLLAIIAIAVPANAQAVTGKAQTDLLTAARANYYNLRFQGVKSFTCNVDIDWDAMFKQFNGKALPADSPMMVYLAKSRLGVKETVTSGAEVTWANSGTPPEELADSASQLRGGVKQMLDGFFQAWTPNINGELFGNGVTGVTATDTGYLVTEKNPDKSTDKLTFDKNMLLSHISSTSANLSDEVGMTYSKTSQGWLVSAIEGDYRQPVTAPPTHITMQAEYQTVDGVQIPGVILLTVKNVAAFNLKLSGCIVEKLTK
jgi:hypothetical protein